MVPEDRNLTVKLNKPFTLPCRPRFAFRSQARSVQGALQVQLDRGWQKFSQKKKSQGKSLTLALGTQQQRQLTYSSFFIIFFNFHFFLDNAADKKLVN